MTKYAADNFAPDIAISYLIRRIHLIATASMEPIFTEEGLTGTQWQALITIWLGRGETAAEISRDLGYDQGAMTRLVDALEGRGWITRERTTDDRRRMILHLTDTGAAIAVRCKDRVVNCWNSWLVGWSEEDVTTLIRLLQKARSTLTDAAGSVKPSAPAGNEGRVGRRDGPPAQTRIAVPVLQLVARGDPAGDADVRTLPAVTAERGRSPVRARDRHLP